MSSSLLGILRIRHIGLQRMVALALLAVILLAAPAVLAQTFDEAKAAYKRGDYAVALELFHVLAEQDNAEAQVHLGFMYDRGKGVPQDAVEAMRWFRKAAEQGDAEGQTRLGIMYDQGYGVPQDYTEALRWYRQAAEQGHAFAQQTLGFMYYLGQGMSQDYVQAHKWVNLAASRFSGSERKWRDGAIQLRNKIASKMTREQIAEAQRLAREWKPGQ